jgi:PPOX class probable F420-dependent enzyme
MTLPDDVAALLRNRAICFVTTLMPDGSPQSTETWVDTDGENVIINTVAGFQKLKNVARDPRVSVVAADPDTPVYYAEIRGRVVGTTEEGGWEHINALSERYVGKAYTAFNEQQRHRVIMTIAPDRVRMMGRR